MGATATLKAEVAKLYTQPRIEVEYGDPDVSMADYSVYVTHISSFHYDTSLTAGTCVIEMSNHASTFNFFIAPDADPAPMGQDRVITVKLYFPGFDPGDYLSLFKGEIDRVEYIGEKAVIYAKDHGLDILDKRLQDGQDPLIMTDVSPATMAWSLLTNRVHSSASGFVDEDLVFGAGLDHTESTDNVDIDYDSWVAWAAACAGNSYQLAARFTSHTIRSAILKIMDLTNSICWINGDGKFEFAPPWGAADRDFTRTYCEMIDLTMTKEDMFNFIECYYNYDATTDQWEGAVNYESGVGVTNYGKIPVYEEDKNLWHSNSVSAENFIEDKLTYQESPFGWVTIYSTLYGYAGFLGDEATVTDALKGLSDDTFRIYEIVNLDPMTGTIILKGLVTTL